MKKRVKRAISMLLTVVLLFQQFPLESFAVYNDPFTAEGNQNTSLETVSGVEDEHTAELPDEAYIIGEVIDKRGESEKHFRLSDGSFIAAQYDTPVHYLEDGKWVDIDNTLTALETYDGAGDASYVVANDEVAEVFAPNLFNGTVLSAENGDSSFVMSLWDGQPTEAAEAEEPQNNNEEDTPPDSQSETSSEPLPDEETASDGETTSNSVPADETSPEPAAAEETAALEDTIASNSGDATETKGTVSTLVADADVETISDNESGEELSEGTPPSEDSPESEENLDEDTSDEESQEADLEVDSVEFNRDVVATVVDTAELGTYDLSTEDTDDVWKQTDVIPSTLRSCILYEDAYPNVDLQYDLFGYNIKESIIIKAPMESAVDDASANQESVDYNFLSCLTWIISFP